MYVLSCTRVPGAAGNNGLDFRQHMPLSTTSGVPLIQSTVRVLLK